LVPNRAEGMSVAIEPDMKRWLMVRILDAGAVVKDRRFGDLRLFQLHPPRDGVRRLVGDQRLGKAQIPRSVIPQAAPGYPDRVVPDVLTEAVVVLAAEVAHPGLSVLFEERTLFEIKSQHDLLPQTRQRDRFGSEHHDSKSFGTLRRCLEVVSPSRGASPPGSRTGGTATRYAARQRILRVGQAHRIFQRTPGVKIPKMPVEAPFVGIAVHVEQAKRIG